MAMAVNYGPWRDHIFSWGVDPIDTAGDARRLLSETDGDKKVL